MTSIFKSKEQYLNFRAAWCNANNSPKAKHTNTPCDEWIDATGLSRGTGNMHTKGWVTPTHVVLFNIISNKKPGVGFSSITNKTKLENGAVANEQYDDACRRLRALIYDATLVSLDDAGLKTKYRVVSDAQVIAVRKRMEESITTFLELFNGTVTSDMLHNVPVESITNNTEVAQ